MNININSQNEDLEKDMENIDKKEKSSTGNFEMNNPQRPMSKYKDRISSAKSNHYHSQPEKKFSIEEFSEREFV